MSYYLQKISEGIDIKAVRNIVMFSADRGHLVTTQRIGRSLRRNPEEPGKKACVVDFVLEGKMRNGMILPRMRSAQSG